MDSPPVRKKRNLSQSPARARVRPHNLDTGSSPSVKKRSHSAEPSPRKRQNTQSKQLSVAIDKTSSTNLTSYPSASLALSPHKPVSGLPTLSHNLSNVPSDTPTLSFSSLANVNKVSVPMAFSSFSTGESIFGNGPSIQSNITTSTFSSTGIGLSFGSLAKAATGNIFAKSSGPPVSKQDKKHANNEDELSNEEDNHTVDKIGTNEDNHPSGPTPITVITGEENEVTVFTLSRAKLFVVVDGVPKERGIGAIKINVNQDNNRTRILMRSEGVHQVLANLPLLPRMSCKVVNDRVVYFVAVLESKLVPHMFRCSSAVQANELCEAVLANIPVTSPHTITSNVPDNIHGHKDLDRNLNGTKLINQHVGHKEENQKGDQTGKDEDDEDKDAIKPSLQENVSSLDEPV